MKIGFILAICSLLQLQLIFGALPFIDESLTQYADPTYDWSEVDQVLDEWLEKRAYPGCVAIVASTSGVIYAKPVGHYTYGIAPPADEDVRPMSLHTIFDLASLTKVTATTTAVAQFYQRGQLPLNTKVNTILGSNWNTGGKTDVTILNLLLHNSGFPPDPNPGFSDPSFGCPETGNYHPAENFSCQKQCYAAILSTALINPIGSTYLYSDLNFLTLGYVVGNLAKQYGYVKSSDLIPGCNLDNSPATAQCYYEAYIRKYVFAPLNMKNSGFLPALYKWPSCAPTENDTDYRHEVMQGQVHDENSYALGGIAGHAGVFSTAPDLFLLMNKLMFAQENDNYLNKTTVKLFTTEYNHTQSSRALGWNTNDPTVYDEGWNLTCGSMSPQTFMHLGYTGTQVCGDTQRLLFTVLLTNRVYPTRFNTQIMYARQQFNTAVVNAFDKHHNERPILLNNNVKEKGKMHKIRL